MSWNGSDQTSHRSDIPAAPKKGEATSKSLLRSSSEKAPKHPTSLPLLSRPAFYLLLLLLLLALAGAAVWYFLRPVDAVSRPRPEKPKKSAPIAAVTPAPARTNKVEKVEKMPKKVVEKTPAIETYVDEHGIKRYKGGARVYDPNAKTEVVRLDCDSQGNPLYKKALFKHRSENEIATLLTLKPGSTLIGTPRYDDRFKQDFVEALLEKNEPTAEDSPQDAEVKRQVDEIKKELADRIKAGEDLGDILLETRREMQKLAAVRRDIREEVLKAARDPNNSSEDVELTLEAANKFLEAKGIAPIRKSGFFTGSMKVDAVKAHESSR